MPGGGVQGGNARGRWLRSGEGVMGSSAGKGRQGWAKIQREVGKMQGNGSKGKEQ
jgi:hypothetical protein